MSRHHFIETNRTDNEYDRLIYCDWCGTVVWSNNANERTTPTVSDLQAQAGDGCKANDGSGEHYACRKLAQGSKSNNKDTHE